MPRKVRVKPSKPSSLFGMIIGIIFVCLGLVFVVPNFGLFGVFWTLIALGMTCYQAYNFFGDKGVASWEVDIDDGLDLERDDTTMPARADFEVKLRKLYRLREDGLITEEEFRQKREEILRERW